MNEAKLESQIIHRKLALDSYLRSLLDEVPDAEGLEENKVFDDESKTFPLDSRVVKPELKDIAESAISSPDRKQFGSVIRREPNSGLALMPEWAQHEFQALFFRVNQLILATPLVELSRTMKIDQKPAKIPGQPSWFIGLLEANDTRIGVLDTGQLIFGKMRGSKRNLEIEPFQRILITKDSQWGLACDEILSIGKLKPEKVRWRTARQKKPWLIGTVIEELTAVVDVRQLAPTKNKHY
jgi:purine-binding chemotaxis protein CheW